MIFLKVFLIGFLIVLEAKAQISQEEHEKLKVFLKLFKESNVNLQEYIKVCKEIEILKATNLDTLAPLKTRRLNYDWLKRGHDSFNHSNAILRLIGTGISERKAFASLACAKEKGLKIGEYDYPKLLLCVLRATGQNIDSLTVHNTTRTALLLNAKTGNGLVAYSAAGINIDIIPTVWKKQKKREYKKKEYELEDLLPKKEGNDD